MDTSVLLLQSSGDSALGLAVAPVFVDVPLVLVPLVMAGRWRAHAKASLPGWTALVPFHDFYRRARRTDTPSRYAALPFVPFAAATVDADFVDLFGRGFVFAFGPFPVPFVFWPPPGFWSYTTGGRRVRRVAERNGYQRRVGSAPM